MRNRLLSTLLALCMVLSLLPTARAEDDLFSDEEQQAYLPSDEEQQTYLPSDEEQQTYLPSEKTETISAAEFESGEWGAIELDGEIIGKVELNPPADWFEEMYGPMPAAEFAYTGQVQLKNSNEIRWIDRIDVPDYALEFYKALEEAADGDGYHDYLIDDEYFDLSGNFGPLYDTLKNNIEPGGYVRLKFSNSSYAAILVAALETDSLDEKGRSYISDCATAVRSAFTMDHPGVFWMRGMSGMSYNYNGRTYVYSVLSYEHTNSEGETSTYDARKEVFRPGGGWNIREQIARRDAAVENILSTIPNGADRYTQVYCINDWLTEHNQYNTLVSAGLSGPWYAWTCLSGLIGYKGADGPVCQGYAVSFKILCDTLGIPCVSVRGDVLSSPDDLSGGYHEWNYLQMEDGKWYIMDVTWNSKPDSTRWFLLGSKTIVSEMEAIKGHPAENWTSGTGLWFTNGPVLSETAYGPLLRYTGMPDSLAVGGSVKLTAQLTRASSGADYVYSVRPALPSGLTLNPDTGKISGKAAAIGGAVNVTVTAANSSDRADFATYILKFPAVEASVHTVTFDANGGTLSGSTTAATSEYGRLPSLPDPAARAGYTFTGWYTESVGGTRVTADTVFTEDAVIYAHWVFTSSASSGKCGTYTEWSYSNGVLTITGRGNISNCGNPDENGTPSPWYDLREQIHTIQISEGVTYIGSYAFYGCSNLTSVTIPESTTLFGNYVFRKCSSLKSVNIPASITSIAYGTFFDCSSLKSVTIPSGVTSIGHLAFRGCGNLEKVDIPSGVIDIGRQAFRDCGSLKSVNIPAGVVSIGSSAFQYCDSLESVNIPASVSSIGSTAFQYCDSLKDVTIPSGVNSIAGSTFWGCSGLRSIDIPSSVGSVGYAAFYKCDGLRDVYYNGNDEQWDKIDIDQFNTSLTKANLHYDGFLPEGADIAAVLDRPSQTVRVTLREKTGSIVGAVYSSGGQLADLVVKPVSAKTMDLRFSKKLPDNCEVKLILIDSSTWRPLREACVVP